MTVKLRGKPTAILWTYWQYYEIIGDRPEVKGVL